MMGSVKPKKIIDAELPVVYKGAYGQQNERARLRTPGKARVRPSVSQPPPWKPYDPSECHK